MESTTGAPNLNIELAAAGLIPAKAGDLADDAVELLAEDGVQRSLPPSAIAGAELAALPKRLCGLPSKTGVITAIGHHTHQHGHETGSGWRVIATLSQQTPA